MQREQDLSKRHLSLPGEPRTENIIFSNAFRSTLTLIESVMRLRLFSTLAASLEDDPGNTREVVDCNPYVLALLCNALI